MDDGQVLAKLTCPARPYIVLGLTFGSPAILAMAVAIMRPNDAAWVYEVVFVCFGLFVLPIWLWLYPKQITLYPKEIVLGRVPLLSSRVAVGDIVGAAAVREGVGVDVPRNRMELVVSQPSGQNTMLVNVQMFDPRSVEKFCEAVRTLIARRTQQ